MTLKELIYNIRMQLRDNKVDDIKFTDRNLEFMVNYLRTKLIRQDIQKGRFPGAAVVQSLGVLELERTDRIYDGKISTGDWISRSKQVLPKTVDVNGEDLITYVGGLDTGNKIDFKPKAQAVKNRHSKYASKRDVAYLFDGRIYLPKGDNRITHITVSGVFENPREVAAFKNGDGNPCFDVLNDPYPMSAHMVDMLNSLIKRQELDLYFQLPEDKLNDGQALL